MIRICYEREIGESYACGTERNLHRSPLLTLSSVGTIKLLFTRYGMNKSIKFWLSTMSAVMFFSNAILRCQAP